MLGGEVKHGAVLNEAAFRHSNVEVLEDSSIAQKTSSCDELLAVVLSVRHGVERDHQTVDDNYNRCNIIANSGAVDVH